MDSIAYEQEQETPIITKSGRRVTPLKRFEKNFVSPERSNSISKRHSIAEEEAFEDSPNREQLTEGFQQTTICAKDMHSLHEVETVVGRNIFGFSTLKKRRGMELAARSTLNTITTSKMLDRKYHNSTKETKTPSRLRTRLKYQIAKLMEKNPESDFSADGSEFEPSYSDIDSSGDCDCSSPEDAVDDEPKTPHKVRQTIVIPVMSKTSSHQVRRSARAKRFMEFIPQSDEYFQSYSNSKIQTSDHTLDRLKHPQLPSVRLLSLLAEMKISTEHEGSLNALTQEYRSYFPKWIRILNEGFNILLYGLGSKRQLLQIFHREMLLEHTVLVVNGFFPSLMVKDILDSITVEILDAGVSSANPHETLDMIDKELALMSDTHLYLIVHNLDGLMLRNVKAQSVLARLAKMPKIHLLASIDHINTPLLWNQTKLSMLNFSWWDCTTMLSYSDETAFENSLLVLNAGEHAVSSLRSVFSSLTTNSRGIFMLIVKYQLKNKSSPNYQGLSFKDLYWNCRESFLVSSDIGLRAQLTEFLDHKLVKLKRNIDGSEQLSIPIDSMLLQKFLDEQNKK